MDGFDCSKFSRVKNVNGYCYTLLYTVAGEQLRVAAIVFIGFVDTNSRRSERKFQSVDVVV